MESKKTNVYSYSAAENEEIKRIREKYEYRNETDIKLEKIRKLDRKTHVIATIFSLISGVLGLLIFGFGMSCVLVWKESLFMTGIIVGIIGMVFIILALPIYNFTEEKIKKKVAPEIIKLVDELQKND